MCESVRRCPLEEPPQPLVTFTYAVAKAVESRKMQSTLRRLLRKTIEANYKYTCYIALQLERDENIPYPTHVRTALSSALLQPTKKIAYRIYGDVSLRERWKGSMPTVSLFLRR